MRPDRVSTALAKWIGEVTMEHSCDPIRREEQPFCVSVLVARGGPNSGVLKLYSSFQAITDHASRLFRP